MFMKVLCSKLMHSKLLQDAQSTHAHRSGANWGEVELFSPEAAKGSSRLQLELPRCQHHSLKGCPMLCYLTKYFSGLEHYAACWHSAPGCNPKSLCPVPRRCSSPSLQQQWLVLWPSAHYRASHIPHPHWPPPGPGGTWPHLPYRAMQLCTWAQGPAYAPLYHQLTALGHTCRWLALSISWTGLSLILFF